jgi:hypothetical protein
MVILTHALIVAKNVALLFVSSYSTSFLGFHCQFVWRCNRQQTRLISPCLFAQRAVGIARGFTPISCKGAMHCTLTGNGSYLIIKQTIPENHERDFCAWVGEVFAVLWTRFAGPVREITQALCQFQQGNGFAHR